MSNLTTYPLRLPKSIKAAAERLSKADGTSLNQFVATAVAEKIAVMETVTYFEARAERARAREARGEPSALLAILNRTDGEPPREGDELPKGCLPSGGPAMPAGTAKSKGQAQAQPAKSSALARKTAPKRT
jgi:hypothetical protein